MSHEVLDAGSEIVLPTPRSRLRLGKVRECRRELVKVYQEARSGIIDTQTATRLAYLLQTLSNMIRDSELEERMAILENKLSG